MSKKVDTCTFCVIVGYYVTWGFLIFGGIVSGMHYFGFAAPALTLERIATYLMALSLLIFALHYLVVRATHQWRSY